MNDNYLGIGRRKKATARVYLKNGSGESAVLTRKKRQVNKKIFNVKSKIIKLEKFLSGGNKVDSVSSDQQKALEENHSSSINRLEVERKIKELKEKLEYKKKNKDKEIKDYFYMQPFLCREIYKPLKLFNKEEEYDILVRVQGGGFHSQAEAIRLGIARALLKIFPDYKTTLKNFSLLTRDSRKVERKKIGLKKARRAPQFSKR
jgi:small subunit ribosomal protein S9